MIEGEPGNDHSFEEAYASLQEAVEPVLTGYRPRVDILVKARNPWTGKTKVSFPPLPSVSSEIAHRAVEALKKELGYEYYNKEHGVGGEKAREYFLREGKPLYIPILIRDVVFTRTELYEVNRGDELAGVVWSLENLKPMNWIKVLGVKTGEIAQRARRAIGFAQYYQG